jgi:hypothetical protein
MSNPLAVQISGPLSSFAPRFLEDLIRQGYRRDTAAKQLQLMAHMSQWLAARELQGAELTADRLEQFLAELPGSNRGVQASTGVDTTIAFSLEEALWIKRSQRVRSFGKRFAASVVSTSNSTADKRSSCARAIMGTRGLCRVG